MLNYFFFIRNLRFFINLLLLIKYVECWCWNKCYQNVELSIETINVCSTDVNLFQDWYQDTKSSFLNIWIFLMFLSCITKFALGFFYKLLYFIRHVKTGYKTGCIWNINTEMKHVCTLLCSVYFLFYYLNFLSPPATCQSVSVLKWRCSVRVIIFSFDRCN